MAGGRLVVGSSALTNVAYPAAGCNVLASFWCCVVTKHSYNRVVFLFSLAYACGPAHCMIGCDV